MKVGAGLGAVELGTADGAELGATDGAPLARHSWSRSYSLNSSSICDDVPTDELALFNPHLNLCGLEASVWFRSSNERHVGAAMQRWAHFCGPPASLRYVIRLVPLPSSSMPYEAESESRLSSIAAAKLAK